MLINLFEMAVYILVILQIYSVLKDVPWLFALVGIITLSFLDYLAISDIIKSWPPTTFLHGAEVFFVIPFLTFGVLVYIMMFYLGITGQLKDLTNDDSEGE